MADAPAVDESELQRFARRAGERWPLQRAIVGGARIDDARRVVPQRERGPEFVVILVADGFAGTPWLERVHAAAALWDADAMGAPAELHCYTLEEFERRRSAQPVVRFGRRSGEWISSSEGSFRPWGRRFLAHRHVSAAAVSQGMEHT